ncbi:LamG domain-containing protein [Archangium violaceum]|uniref:LamG domain-containing protein n=1 Tax=Archangium violaceum TaxID=83451 RepID=UPI00194FF3A5|nr:LamG domain-containing protein [Archangium violaceum]QRN93325.1 LamG domain-containing protein [Archangium violaceum]
MGRSFAITTSTPSVQLDGAARGEISFTVTNSIGRPVRARVLIEPEGAARKEWLTLVGEPERDLPSDGTLQYTVQVAVPPGTPDGTYSFHPSVVNVEHPDEEFSLGPAVAIQVSRPVEPVRGKRFPWWAVALAAGILFITLTVALVARAHRDPGTGGSGDAGFLHFDGTASYIDLGNPRSLNIEGPITLEAWIRPLALDGLRDIVAHGYILSPPREIFFRIVNGTYQVGSWDGGDHSAVARVPSSDVGQWIHLAGVYDGAQWLLYRNGELLVSTPQPPDVVHSFSAPWAIGARGGGGERFFQGDMRDVLIWNVPRSQEEIRSDMQRAPKKDAPGLVGYWPLDDGQGSIARDMSPHQHHGVLREAAWDSR